MRVELLLAALCLAAPAAGAPETRTVVVGSKNFTESRLLGDLMTLVIEAHTDLDVRHESSLGGTKICFDSLRGGEIDVYAEYTGTAWSILLKEEARVSDSLRAFLRVESRSRELWDLEWLDPFGFENGYALTMNAERADALGIRSISDLREHQADLSAAFSIEFTNREDGWRGISAFYDLELAEVRSLEHGLAYEAVAAGAADVIDAYTTDGKLLRFGLRVLEDDRGFFPPYDAAPVVRGELLREHPEVRAALGRLAFRIDDAAMTAMNYAIEEEGADFVAVARAFLEAEGLLEAGAESAARPGTGEGFVAFFLGRWPTTLSLLGEHVLLTLVAVLLAAAIAVPLGVFVSARPSLERLALGGAGVIQTIPSLALLAFMIPIPGLGLSERSAVAALLLYAVLPVLRNTVTGLQGVDPDLVDAARGMGLTDRQILVHVRLPLATRTIMAGLRTATVISIGVATLAAFIGAGGLGEPIVEGLYLNQPELVLAGALPAAALALVADALLGLLERAWTPRGLRAS